MKDLPESRWTVPNSWVWTKLSALGDIVAGGTPSTKEPTYWADEISWISPADLTGYSAKTIKRGAKSISRIGLANSSAKVMPAGSVHFSTRAPIGHVVISSEPLATNQGFKSLVPAPGIFNDYVYYYLMASRDYARKRGSGTTFLELSGRAFGELPIPLAPTATQHKVVAKIEELFSELDKGIESLKAARAKLKVYRQAVLNSAATGRLLVERGYRSSSFGDDETTSLEDVVKELGQGWSPRCLNHPSPEDEVWGVIKTTAIQHLAFDEAENKELPEHLKPRPHLSIETGDILVTRAGPRKRVGVACLVRSCRPRLMLCDKAYRLRVDERKLLPKYLEMLLNSPTVLSDVEQLKTGISDSGVNLTQKRFLSLKIPVPSIADQNRTLAEVENILSNIENAEAQIQDVLLKVDALRQSILKEAFNGQLVAQDPHDEPASVLLNRIRAEREKAMQNNHSKKTKKRKTTA